MTKIIFIFISSLISLTSSTCFGMHTNSMQTSHQVILTRDITSSDNEKFYRLYKTLRNGNNSIKSFDLSAANNLMIIKNKYLTNFINTLKHKNCEIINLTLNVEDFVSWPIYMQNDFIELFCSDQCKILKLKLEGEYVSMEWWQFFTNKLQHKMDVSFDGLLTYNNGDENNFFSSSLFN